MSTTYLIFSIVCLVLGFKSGADQNFFFITSIVFGIGSTIHTKIDGLK